MPYLGGIRAAYYQRGANQLIAIPTVHGFVYSIERMVVYQPIALNLENLSQTYDPAAAKIRPPIPNGLRITGLLTLYDESLIETICDQITFGKESDLNIIIEYFQKGRREALQKKFTKVIPCSTPGVSLPLANKPVDTGEFPLQELSFRVAIPQDKKLSDFITTTTVNV